ncbi:MAG: glycosyltransferase family 39 protein [Planctomycetes bacterium]|nr:glycosyltransferase family 39 protein [Planctomycetota bacterium]
MMPTTRDIAPAGQQRKSHATAICAAALLIIVALGTYLRVHELGARSLWQDEFSTWHVSRLGLADGLRWQPAVKMAPLYPTCLHWLTAAPRPTEWLLRAPAAAFGVLAILAAFWLGRCVADWTVGCALAALVACHVLQIEYSREARSYTMLVCGSTVALWLWYELVRRPRGIYFAAYVLAATFALHAHYLAGLAILSHGAWWLLVMLCGPKQRRSLWPLLALGITAVLCTPVVLRFFCFRAAGYSGLEWIPALSWTRAWDVLARLTYGKVWIVAMLLPALLVWALAACRRWPHKLFRAGRELCAGTQDMCGLLVACWLGVWFGLVVLSWLVQPALIARYALAASVPALLMPLVVAYRFDRRAPLVIALVFVLGKAPEWFTTQQVRPGFRELVEYLNANADPQRDLVALAVHDTSHPAAIEGERLGFNYYRLERLTVRELYLHPLAADANTTLLGEPRALYVVVFQGDPVPLLESAGRQIIPLQAGGRSYRQLLFSPYRLLKASPPSPVDSRLASARP